MLFQAVLEIRKLPETTAEKVLETTLKGTETPGSLESPNERAIAVVGHLPETTTPEAAPKSRLCEANLVGETPMDQLEYETAGKNPVGTNLEALLLALMSLRTL